MAERPSYYEQLKHPKWQRKRLEIMQRAGFQCEDCGKDDVTLNVHHSYYEKGLAPWEYPDDSLHCLCEKCHKDAQNLQTLLNRQIGKLDSGGLLMLLGYALGLEAEANPETPIAIPPSFETALGLAHCWELDVHEVIDALREDTIDGNKLKELRSRGIAFPRRQEMHQQELRQAMIDIFGEREPPKK